MSDVTIQTVTGPIDADELGRTLAHEHVIIGWPGWDSDSLYRAPARADVIAIAADRIAEMRDHGVKSMIDPCPNDLGRDVELLAEVAADTGFQIVCATGLYKEDQGGGAYWKFRAQFGAGVESVAEMYIRELTVGIGDTGVKAGIIKAATSGPTISEYEAMLLEAAAMASVETGAPILTHTDEGRLGDEQQKILTGHGVPAHRIVIGHSCGTSDHDYHMSIVNGGSYIGFDRFGLDILHPDEERVKSLAKLVSKDKASHVLVSHDTVWCWKGNAIPNQEIATAMAAQWTPTHFFERIVPQLKDAGVDEEQIAMFVDENPRRFFTGEAIPS
jgi:phosphotriesterase-related protein